MLVGGNLIKGASGRSLELVTTLTWALERLVHQLARTRDPQYVCTMYAYPQYSHLKEVLYVSDDPVSPNASLRALHSNGNVLPS